MPASTTATSETTSPAKRSSPDRRQPATSTDRLASKSAPNAEGDWIDQRNDHFGTCPVLGDKRAGRNGQVFGRIPLGLQTNRDAWVYNYSRDAARREHAYDHRLLQRPGTHAAYAEKQASRTTKPVTIHPIRADTKISWSRASSAKSTVHGRIPSSSLTAHDQAMLPAILPATRLLRSRPEPSTRSSCPMHVPDPAPRQRRHLRDRRWRRRRPFCAYDARHTS